jgi:murein L,D-transpeptidase YafK
MKIFRNWRSEFYDKEKGKTYKAGTRIVFHTSCNYVGCESKEDFILDNDSYTDDILQEMANDIALETICPEGYFEVAEETEE